MFRSGLRRDGAGWGCHGSSGAYLQHGDHQEEGVGGPPELSEQEAGQEGESVVFGSAANRRRERETERDAGH